MYFMARHTSIDCYERRGRRGYLFIIGDEMAYPRVKAREVSAIIGGQPTEDVPLRQIVTEVQGLYDTYYLLPEGSCYAGNPQVLTFWRHLLGQNAIEIDDLDAVCETIALTIGLGEDTVNLDQGLNDLRDSGSGATATVAKALNRVGFRP
jgi:hypothetical protein